MTKRVNPITKDELYDILYNKDYRNVVTHKDLAFKCMDAWAEIQTNEFIEWALSNGYAKRHGLNSKWQDQKTRKNYTTSQLFKHFLKITTNEQNSQISTIILKR